jgi:hypothetical protein
MATEFLSRLRAATKRALRLTIAGMRHQAEHGPDTRALVSRLASSNAKLVRADTSWQPKPPLIRIEIMASGPFGRLRGIGTAVNSLQSNLVAAIRKGTLELRLTEVRQTCRHSTAWSREPLDPGASTTTWQCFVDAFADESERSRTLFAQAFRESLRNHVNHVVVFGDRFDDGFFSSAQQYEPSANEEFASLHFISATISTAGTCTISSPPALAVYSCICPVSAGLMLSYRSSRLLPVATAPALPRSRPPLPKRRRSLLNSAGGRALTSDSSFFAVSCPRMRAPSNHGEADGARVCLRGSHRDTGSPASAGDDTMDNQMSEVKRRMTSAAYKRSRVRGLDPNPAISPRPKPVQRSALASPALSQPTPRIRKQRSGLDY